LGGGVSTVRFERSARGAESMHSRRAPVALALLVVVLGCGSGAAVAATSTLPVVHASEGRDGGKVTLRRGQTLQVVLHSTYWRFKAPSTAGVLRLAGKPVVTPKPGCVPGQGCGTVTVTYVARAIGSAAVAASRTSCGEALRCTPAAGSYKLTVAVLR
jgi:hypothetical protein